MIHITFLIQNDILTSFNSRIHITFTMKFTGITKNFLKLYYQVVVKSEVRVRLVTYLGSKYYNYLIQVGHSVYLTNEAVIVTSGLVFCLSL